MLAFSIDYYGIFFGATQSVELFCTYDKNILICVGIIIYIAMSGIDRFVYHIPNIIYIPVAILGIALILIGFFKDKFKQENFDL